jgi:hypothetical protein
MNDNCSISMRAGRALDYLFAGPHRDKRIAQAFNITTRMAKYLCSGNRWTLARYEQARELLGDAWDAAISKPDTNWQYNIETLDHERRLARLEQQLVEMDRRLNARVASPASGSPHSQSRGFAEDDLCTSGDG